MAKASNRSWLKRAFYSKAIARQQFDQPLAPYDGNDDLLQPRTDLHNKLGIAFAGAPSGRVFAVIGAEGVGKSWLVAKTWVQTDPASVLVIVPSNELQDPNDIVDFEDFLIRKIVSQTGSELTESNQKRWKRRFAAWKANPDPQNVRLTLCIDGLNQTPRYPWPRWIDGASYILGELGGNLVVTTRSNHFPALRHAVVPSIVRVIVSEWSKAELDNILRTRTIDPDVLGVEVYETLRNPRILSVALKLIDAREIERIEQLSVGRLLFEHLRTSELTGSTRLSPSEFAKTLRELADEYVLRLNAGTRDDLRLFDTRDHLRLSEVSSGRFFRTVGHDPDRYEIVEEGLRLTLGIWLVEALDKEFRNQRDPFAQLEVVMEPLNALDMTADIVGTATEVACLMGSCAVDVTSALIRHFVGLQNLPEERQGSFAALIRISPEAFVKAARDGALAEGRAGTSDWLDIAILKARSDDRVRGELERQLPEWLSYYSCSPEYMMHSTMQNDAPENVEAERRRVLDNLKTKLEGMTESERHFLEENLTELSEGDVSRLHRLAFFLMAGVPLNQFAAAFVSWAFADSLAASIYAPRREFEHLLRFNVLDWTATRTALLNNIRKLGDARSSVSDWAVVKVLRATGDKDDAAGAEQSAEELSKDRERLHGWRLVESYCSSDPCDPDSPRAENIGDTAEKYRNIPVEEIFLTRGNSAESHFFDMAMPGVARFEPEAGVDAIRRLACHTLTRQGLPRRQALHVLLSNSVLMEREVVNELIASVQAAGEDTLEYFDTNDEWSIALFSMFTAVPHLSGDEQLSALIEVDHGSISLNLVNALKPATASVIERYLKETLSENDIQRMIRLLGAINHSESPLTSTSISIIAELLSAPEKHVRAEALGIASSSENEVLLKRLAESDWDAGRLLAEEDYFEIWYGSSALIAAVSVGDLELGDALDRIAMSHYGFAADRWESTAVSMIADRVEIALERVLNSSEQTDIPEIEQEIATSASSLPPVITLRENASPADARAAFQSLAETEEQFQNRQRLLRRAYARFSRELTNADARLVVTDLTVEGMAAIAAARPDVISRWHSLLLAASQEKKRSLHLFATQFAAAITEKYTELSVSIIRAYSTVEPLVRHVVGTAKIPVETEILWSCGRVPKVAAECTERLEDCISDREIAMEVVAAFKHDQQHILTSYTKQLLDTGEPVHIARALTVARFSNESEFASNALSRFYGTKGFVGEAYEAAQGAYDRNRWARHWYEQLRTTTTAVDFWRYSVLLSKIVDGRFDLWGTAGPAKELFSRFFPTIEGEIRQRIKKWNEKRKDKLFGNKVPHVVFLIRDFSGD